jgi:signal transduction histidine kinase
VEAFQGRLPQLPAVRKPTVVAVSSTIGFVAVISLMIGLFGAAATAQLLVTLIIPAAFMMAFWYLARQRIALNAKSHAAQTASFRANTEFLASIAHELNLHSEPTNLRAEALEVAMEYRVATDNIKVAVPNVVVAMDPFAFRQVLHTLISNAVQHGGDRLAVWGRASESQVEISVSDDGPGVAQELGDRVFERFVDLGATALSSTGTGSGLSIAREVSGLMGGELSYQRDSVWTHFTLTMPVLARSGSHDIVHIDIEVEASVR